MWLTILYPNRMYLLLPMDNTLCLAVLESEGQRFMWENASLETDSKSN